MANISNSLYLNTSRYVHGGNTEAANKRIEWWDKFTFPTDPYDTIYVVEQIFNGNPQSISTKFFGDPRYWWVICQYNNILDPISEIVSGTVLRIPTSDRLALMMLGRTGGKPTQRELTPTVSPVII